MFGLSFLGIINSYIVLNIIFKIIVAQVRQTVIYSRIENEKH